jgi:hypothetical protein
MALYTFMTVKSKRSNFFRTNQLKESPSRALISRELIKLKTSSWSADIIKVRFRYMKLKDYCSSGKCLNLKQDK